jgi:hypothetical protein
LFAPEEPGAEKFFRDQRKKKSFTEVPHNRRASLQVINAKAKTPRSLLDDFSKAR